MDYIKVENRKIKNSQFDGQYSSLKPQLTIPKLKYATNPLGLHIGLKIAHMQGNKTPSFQTSKKSNTFYHSLGGKSQSPDDVVVKNKSNTI